MSKQEPTMSRRSPPPPSMWHLRPRAPLERTPKWQLLHQSNSHLPPQTTPPPNPLAPPPSQAPPGLPRASPPTPRLSHRSECKSWHPKESRQLARTALRLPPSPGLFASPAQALRAPGVPAEDPNGPTLLQTLLAHLANLLLEKKLSRKATIFTV